MNLLLILLIAIIPLYCAQPLNTNPQDRDPNEFCKKCWERRNQKDYYANEFNCTTYYHCFKNGSRIEGILRPCAHGLRFDEHILACVPMISPGRCDDPCSNPDTMMEGWWQDTTMPQEGCGIFYQCANYYSIKMCCPPNHSFNKTWGDCMWDPQCTHHNDECGKQSITVPMWTPRQVDFETCDDVQYGVIRKVHPDPAKYIVILPHKQHTMDCPPATHFDLVTCKCSIHANYTEPTPFNECLLDVSAGPKNQIKDASHMVFWVDRDGVKTTPIGPPAIPDSWAIDCPGNKHVEVPGLQGLSLGHKVSVMAWVKPKCDKTNGVIVSNRGEGMALPASIEFTEVGTVGVPDSWTVKMTLRTVKFEYTKNLKVTCGSWNFVAVTYDGMTFNYYSKWGSGQAQESMDSLAVRTWEEVIYWMVHCPLSICENINDVNGLHEFIGYNGDVDRVRICRHVISKEDLQTIAFAESTSHPLSP